MFVRCSQPFKRKSWRSLQVAKPHLNYFFLSKKIVHLKYQKKKIASRPLFFKEFSYRCFLGIERETKNFENVLDNVFDKHEETKSVVCQQQFVAVVVAAGFLVVRYTHTFTLTLPLPHTHTHTYLHVRTYTYMHNNTARRRLTFRNR